MHDDPQALSADVGKALKATRRRLGITQATLSAKTGIPQADISRLENGRANPAISTLGRLADGLGCWLRIELSKPDAGGEDTYGDGMKHTRLLH